MADLKEINEDALLKAIAQAEAYAHESIARTAQQAVEEVKQVLAARAALPERATDLLLDAAVAEVGEVDLVPFTYGRTPNDLDIGNASFVVCGNTQRVSASNSRTRVKAGRYRALFFLLPLPAREP